MAEPSAGTVSLLCPQEGCWDQKRLQHKCGAARRERALVSAQGYTSGEGSSPKMSEQRAPWRKGLTPKHPVLLQPLKNQAVLSEGLTIAKGIRNWLT